MTFQTNEIEIFEEIHDQLNTNFNQRIRVRDLALRYGISRSTLTRGFQHYYHKTIPEYRLECCMQYAKKLIEEVQQIKSVRIALGYKTNSGFTKSFRRMYGYSPHR